MVTRESSVKVIFTAGMAILLVLIAIYSGMALRYKYWHFYIHNELTFFLDREFRDLMNKYGKENNVASFERKERLGINVTYPIRNNLDYSIQLSLEKNLRTNSFIFKAEISSPEKKEHWNIGNPPIYMEIPMKYFMRVIENGLEQNQINSLIETADRAGWKRSEFNTEAKLKPSIILKFNDE